MSRNYLFHTLVSSACLSLSLPTLATDDAERILALPSTAITGDRDSQREAIKLATPLPTGSRLNLSALETPASTSASRRSRSRSGLSSAGLGSGPPSMA